MPRLDFFPTPRLPGWWSRLNAQTLRGDALAGLLSAILVLPQGIAFATLAGLPPQYGLYTATVPCIVAALAGSSWQVVTGPTNAMSLALLAMLAPLAVVGSPSYIGLALGVTVLVGLLQFLTGALRLGAIANFISPTALLGFMTGAAGLIALQSLKSATGLALAQDLHAIEVPWAIVQRLDDLQFGAVLVAASSLLATTLCRRWWPRSPFMLVGLVLGTVVAVALQSGVELGWLPATASTQRVGPLPSAWPTWSLPHLSWQALPQMMGIAAALTVVALAQSIAIAKAVAELAGQRIDANREFMGQGLANLAGGFFSCYVACGSLTRSMPHLEAGARTPLAAVLSALLVVPLVALSAPGLALIPMAAIAGLLLQVAWTLMAPASWRRLAQASRTEWAIAALTCLATLTVRLELAILIGSALSLGLYLQRSARPALREMGFDRREQPRRFVVREDHPDSLPTCPQLQLLRMEGSVYFGATAYVSDMLQAQREQHPGQTHLLIMARSMNMVDVAGSALWHSELRHRRSLGGDLYFHRPRPPVLAQWERDGTLAILGTDHLFPDKATAIAAIVQRLDPERCRACSVRVFRDCGPPGTAPQRPSAA
jgi:SulP family sulfate permease